MAIYDTMQFIKPDVSTICTGLARQHGRIPAGRRRQGQALLAAELAHHDSPAVGGVAGPGSGHRDPRARKSCICANG